MNSDQPWRSPEAALRERVKELACLYGIAELAADQDMPLDALLEGVVKLLPAAWQYPEVTAARIVLDGHSYDCRDVNQRSGSQAADVTVAGAVRGRVEVAYVEPRPALDEGPFLKEERHLIDAVARQIA